MNWYAKRSEHEEYKQHHIHVLAMQVVQGAAWVIEVHVLRPDGSWLPVVADHDNAYPSLSIAFASGSQIGQELVDGGGH